MSDVFKTKHISHYRIDIITDPDPLNPRTEYDNLATLACFHRRYQLGDPKVHENSSVGAEEFDDYLKEEEDKLFTMPLFLYDHSGITISTAPFSCSWDSGQIGRAYIEKEKVLKEFNFPEWNEEAEKKAREIIEGEVKTYDTFLRGEVYGFRITDTRSGDEMDSCWGFFGQEDCLYEAESIVSYYVEKDEHFEKNAVISTRYVSIKVRVKHMPDVDPDMILSEMDYNLTSTSPNSEIVDTDIDQFSEEAF